MYENSEDYQKLVDRHLKTIEIRIGLRICHGDTGICPRCGAPGEYDIDGPGFDHTIGNAIYFSTVSNEWRCRVCDFKACS